MISLARAQRKRRSALARKSNVVASRERTPGRSTAPRSATPQASATALPRFENQTTTRAATASASHAPRSNVAATAAIPSAMAQPASTAVRRGGGSPPRALGRSRPRRCLARSVSRRSRWDRSPRGRAARRTSERGRCEERPFCAPSEAPRRLLARSPPSACYSSRVGPTLLDRMIARELALPLGVGLFAILQLLVVAQLLQLNEVVFSSAVTLNELGRLTAALLPHFLVLAIPLAYMLGLQLALGRMAIDREIMALTAAGTPLRRLYRVPVVVAVALGFAVAALAAWEIGRAHV